MAVHGQLVEPAVCLSDLYDVFLLDRTIVQNYFASHVYIYKLWPGQAQYMAILTFI